MKIAHFFLAALLLCCLAVSAKPAAAATVECEMQCSDGWYNAYLFRVGDRLPTSSIMSIKSTQGGVQIRFPGIGTGHWFIRVVAQRDQYANQTAAGALDSYLSRPLDLGNLNMYGIAGE